MQRTTTNSRRRLALVASVPFLALGLAACGDDEPIAPEEGETTEEAPPTTDGGDTETDDGETDGGDTETDDGETEGGASGDLSEFDNGEGAPGIFTANPGECIDSVAADTVISCDDEHDLEVYYTFNVEGDEFPGEDAIQTEARTACEENFEAYVGSAPGDSEYTTYAMYPSAETWSQAGDTEVICMLQSASPTTGSGYQSGS